MDYLGDSYFIVDLLFLSVLLSEIVSC